MLRIRFKTKAEDYRPVNWPVKHPYWCTGDGWDYSEGGNYSILISYADDQDYISRNWPEAYDLEVQNVKGYEFTSRFPKPEWFKG